MKNNFYLIISFILFSCSNLSPNKNQIKSTKENIECFQELITDIIQTESLRNSIIEIRNDKKIGKGDPVTVEQKYRLISFEEIEKNLPSLWKEKCLKKLKDNRDFRGLRYINKDSIIIEIDKFERRTLSEKYTQYGTVEIHRIIISKGEIKNQSYKFRGENRKFTEKFENDWLYEITQMKGH